MTHASVMGIHPLLPPFPSLTHLPLVMLMLWKAVVSAQDREDITGKIPRSINPNLPRNAHSFLRHESNLRLQLFNKSDYNPQTRPSTSTEVYIRLNIISILELDMTAQTMSVCGWLSIRWWDSRLSWNSSRHGGITKLVDTAGWFWYPSIDIDNSVVSHRVTRENSAMMYVTSEGKVCWEPPFVFKTSCLFDLTFYPFDKQSCDIDVSSWGHSMDLVHTTFFNDSEDIQVLVENGEWEFLSGHEHSTVFSFGGYDYTALTFTLKLSRRARYYVMNVIIPIVCSTFLIVFVYLVPYESGSKVSYSITVLLSYILLLKLTSEKMPRTSFQTSLLALYMLVNLFTGALTMVVTILNLVCYFHNDNPPPSPRLQKFARVLARAVGFSWNTQGTGQADKVSLVGRLTDLFSFVPCASKDVRPGTAMLDSYAWREIAFISDAFAFPASLAFVLSVTVAFCLAASIGGHLQNPVTI